MNEDIYVFHSHSEQDTQNLGKILADFAQAGDVFALFGTLGMGKSVLARSFIQNLTDATEVPSPTFTLVQTYDSTNFEIYHFDLYRLKSPEEIFEIGMEEALYGNVCFIEWPEKMGGYLPRDIFKVTLEPENDGRKITIEAFSPQRKARLKELSRNA